MKQLNEKQTSFCEAPRPIKRMSVLEEIRAEGLLSKLQQRVYEILFFYGPMTQMEACRRIKKEFHQDRSYTPRFAELKRMGAIREAGKRNCHITQRQALTWDVTCAKPSPKGPKVKSVSQKLKDAEEFIMKRGLQNDYETFLKSISGC